MYVRVVRFEDADDERVAGLRARIEGRDGPPPGVDSTGITFLHDRDQQTVVVMQRFASAEAMASSEAALEAMDPSQTPGTRVSVDRCEVLVELSVD